MADAERINQIKLLNKARSSRYYDAHKVDVSTRRKEQRKVVKELKDTQKALQAPNVPNVPNVELQQDFDVDVDMEPVAPVAPVVKGKKAKNIVAVPEVVPEPVPQQYETVVVKGKKVKKPVVSKVYTSDMARSNLDNIGIHGIDINGLNQLERLLDIEDYNKAFLDGSHVINVIDNSLQQNSDKPYAVNSKKALYQTVLTLITKLQLPVPPQEIRKLKDMFEVYKLRSLAEKQHKLETVKLLSFDEYLPKVKEHFGEDSKEYLVAKIYSSSGFRDDLLINIQKTQEDADKDLGTNSVVIPTDKKENCTIVMNIYKTDKKNGQGLIGMSKEISDLIRAYKKNNKIVYGRFMFGDKPLSRFVSNFNRKMGLKITINTFRSMLVSDRYEHAAKDTAGEVLPEVKVNIAKMMKHSVGTSLQYLHKKKK